MEEYFAARKIYRKNMLIGIVACLFLNVLGTDVIGPWLNCPQKVVFTLSPLAVMLLYFVYSKVRKATKKEDAYTGRLRIIPKAFMIYMFLNIIISLALLGL